MSVGNMSCIHNDDFSYLNAKKVNEIEGEVSSFLEIHFKAEEESSKGGMGSIFTQEKVHSGQFRD